MNSILKIVVLLKLNAVLFDKNHIKYKTSVVWLFEVKTANKFIFFCITNIDRLILFFFGCLWILWKISINIPWLSEYTVESLFRSLVENLFWLTLQYIVRQYVFIGICSNEIHVHTKNIINMQFMSIMSFCSQTPQKWFASYERKHTAHGVRWI